jgi:copper chaperone CopZ
MGSVNYVYILVIVAIIIAGIYAFKSYRKKLTTGCCGGGDSQNVERIRVSDRNPAHYPYTAVLTIYGMVCSNCAVRIENALNTIDSVWAQVDLPQKQAIVCMKYEVNDDDLRSAVNSLGSYTVMNIERKKNVSN